MQLLYFYIYTESSYIEGVIDLCKKCQNKTLTVGSNYMFKNIPICKMHICNNLPNYVVRYWTKQFFLKILSHIITKVTPNCIKVMLLQTCTIVIWSSWITRLSAILILRYSSSKKTTSFVFYCFSKPTFTHISGNKCLSLMVFSAKCSLCNVV